MPISTEAYIAHKAGDAPSLETIHYDRVDEHEILVQNAAFSVCASDLKAAKGAFFEKPPMILGHEAAGIVKEVGNLVTSVKPGDKVVLAFDHCRTCRMCTSGESAYCEKLLALNFSGTRSDGSHAATDEDGKPLKAFFFGQSSMARLVLAHKTCAVKVEATDEELIKFAALGCGIQTGAGAILNVCKPQPGSNIAIIGAGAVGLSAAYAANLSSPSLLCLADNNATKLSFLPTDIASATTSLHTADLSPSDLTTSLRDLTPDKRGFDYILDCVGSSSLLASAHEALAPRGTLVTVGGGPPGAKAEIGMTGQLIGGRTYRGTHQGDSVPEKMVPMLIGLWRRGRFPFDKFLGMYEFGDLEKALADLEAGKVGKVVLKC